MLPNRKGHFLATIGAIGVAPTGKNNLVTVTANYRIVSEWDGSEYVDVSDAEFDINGYHYIEKRDGSLNESSINQLKSAYGWDGIDPFWFEDSLPEDLIVKLTLDFEEYDGQSKLKLKWIDHKDATGGGGVTRSTPNERTAISVKLGSKLRAVSGAPAKPPAKPAAASKPAIPSRRSARSATKDDAWGTFLKNYSDDATDEHLLKEWESLFAAVFPGKSDDDMTPADWAKLQDEANPKKVPF